MSGQQHPLADRTLVVSGGSRGIGLAIALGAVRLGANAVLLAKTSEPHPTLPGTVHTAVADIEAAGGKGLAVVGDVRNEEDVQRAVDAAVERFGGVDVVVNNASAIATDPTEKLSAKKFDLMMDINVRGTFLLTKAALPHLRNSPNAHVVTLAPPLNLSPQWLGAHTVVHAVQVRHDAAVAGLGGRICRGQNRIQLPVAADLHRDLGGDQPRRRRRPRLGLAEPGHHGRRRGRHPDQLGGRDETGSASSTPTSSRRRASPTCPGTAAGTTPSGTSSSTRRWPRREHLAAAGDGGVG